MGSKAILVRSQDGNLWRSTDGASWEKNSVPEKMAGVHTHQVECLLLEFTNSLDYEYRDKFTKGISLIRELL
jgi:hypothetical protein